MLSDQFPQKGEMHQWSIARGFMHLENKHFVLRGIFVLNAQVENMGSLLSFEHNEPLTTILGKLLMSPFGLFLVVLLLHVCIGYCIKNAT